MSFKSLNVHPSSLAIKRESFDSTVAIKLEALESPPKHSYMPMHHMSSTSPNDLLKCKKSVNFAKMSYPSPLTPQPSVARRNERERNRVKMVNMGFATLRNHVPNGAKNKKMSKVETLRSAVEYIRQLQKLLGNQGSENSFSFEEYSTDSQVPSLSEDENCYPDYQESQDSPSPMESSAGLEHLSYGNQVGHYSSMGGSMYSPSSSEMSSKPHHAYNLPPAMGERISPAPSIGSDITSSSSPYNNHSLMDNTAAAAAIRQTATVHGHEDELFDFTWF